MENAPKDGHALHQRLKGVDEDAIARAAEPLQRLCADRDVAFIINDSVALAEALKAGPSVDDALSEWNKDRTATNNGLVQFGIQLGRALVKEIPDWSNMDVNSMETWFNSIVTFDTEYLPASK